MGGKVWVKRKDETPNFIINSKGRKIENIEEILKEYQEYYEFLLQTVPPENLPEKNRRRCKCKISKNCT